MTLEPRATDPRAVRVRLAAESDSGDAAPVVVEPPEIPLAPAPGGQGLAGLPTAAGEVDGRIRPPAYLDPHDSARVVLVDGEPVAAFVTPMGAGRVRLDTPGHEPSRRIVLLGEPSEGAAPGTLEREVVIDGWRFVVETESERRAALRGRASRGREAPGSGGRVDIRAVIPGRVVSVSVSAGDTVSAGQQLMVVEAMKMQNELRAPRDGTVERVATEAGRTIEVGDVLVVLA
ncbi:MAG TPA: biotin/lipoyl-containing protein [Vitreimonas sp.]|nr:biotin/lipoyl-containing protein [Vitreimonas sp.]